MHCKFEIILVFFILLAFSGTLQGCFSGDKSSSTEQGTRQPAASCSARAELVKSDIDTVSSNLEWKKKVYSGLGTIWLSRKYRLPARFEYVAHCDGGNVKRKKNFSLDPDETDWQQNSTRSYPRTCIAPQCDQCGSSNLCITQCAGRSDGVWSSFGASFDEFKKNCVEFLSYDRGHQIPANHVDDAEEHIALSNYMTNISPQASSMNRGAWLYTEELIECMRDLETLEVIGGSVWNDDDNEPNMVGRNEWFRASHGVQTPVYFWKIIKIKRDGVIAQWLRQPDVQPTKVDHIAFWIPNTEDATRQNIDDYVITLTTLEENLRKYDQAETFTKMDLESPSQCYREDETCKAWPIPPNCDKS